MIGHCRVEWRNRLFKNLPNDCCSCFSFLWWMKLSKNYFFQKQAFGRRSYSLLWGHALGIDILINGNLFWFHHLCVCLRMQVLKWADVEEIVCPEQFGSILKDYTKSWLSAFLIFFLLRSKSLRNFLTSNVQTWHFVNCYKHHKVLCFLKMNNTCRVLTEWFISSYFYWSKWSVFRHFIC